MSTPEMTVVLMVDQRRQRAARSLGSVLAQTAIDRLEILLYDFAHGSKPPVAGSDHPAVTVIPASYPNSIGAVRLAGFRRASAPLVAFLEEHTRAEPEWAAALLARFTSGPWAGVGAEVLNLNPGGLVGDALFLMNYTGFIAPAEGGPSPLLQGNNSAYRRDSVLALGEDLIDLLEIESLLDWRLGSQGATLYVEPAAKFAHANEHIVLAFWEGNYLFSRLFGALRAQAQHWTPADRWLRVAAAPLLPLLRVARLLRFVRAKRPQDLPLVVRGMPYIISAQYASVIGQSIGLVFGEGRSREQFLFYEMNMVRDEVI